MVPFGLYVLVLKAYQANHRFTITGTICWLHSKKVLTVLEDIREWARFLESTKPSIFQYNSLNFFTHFNDIMI